MADFDRDGFLRFSDRLQSHKIVQEDKLGKSFVGLGATSLHDPAIHATMSQAFSTEELESLILRVRIFLNKRDRVYFEDAYDYAKMIAENIHETESKEALAKLEAAYSNFKYRPTMRILREADGIAIDPNAGPTSDELVDLMLNAELFHNDADKQEQIRMRKEIAGNMIDLETRAFYLALRDFIKLIAEIKNVVAVDKQK